MDVYRIRTSWGDDIHFAAELSQASAPIRHVDDETMEILGDSQYQTADASHRLEDAARLYIKLLGPEYYRSPDFQGTDDEAVEAAIDSVQPIEE